MQKSSESNTALSAIMSVSDWRKTWDIYVRENENYQKKAPEAPPDWVRFVAGALGFFSFLLLLGVPGIALLIMDRVIPSGTTASIWPLVGLGLGTIISVCLIDLMRMKALENYFVNVRGLILYQDVCFAIFWAVVIGFIHPLLSAISLCVAAILYLVWATRKPADRAQQRRQWQSNTDPVIADASGLGSAYLQHAAEGKVNAKEQPDFQTAGQTTWLNLVQLCSIIGTLGLTASLHLQGLITTGTMLAIIFLNQFITMAMVRFYQVQALKSPKPDLSFLSIIGDGGIERATPPKSDDGMDMLSISDVEDFGFAPFSADLFQGLCLALIGPTGCGKSEILRAIATGQFYEGKITYRGRNWGRNHGRLSPISYASIPPVHLDGTVVENVTGFDPRASALAAIELLRKLDPFEDVFGDIDFVNQGIQANNLAQAQIAQLARAFCLDSDIIILDQPETYLDKASRSALMALILRAKTEGKIVLLSTDDDYLMSAADELVKLERGEVTDRGPMEEVLNRHHQRWVRVSFRPTKREAFRLALWLEAQFPEGMSEEFKTRVKQTAQDMLFFAPRDQIMEKEEEILFDLRMSPHEVFITMHDRGDVMAMDQLRGAEKQEYDRVLQQADGFEQTLREGYRQFALRFSADRSQSDQALIAGG